MGEPIFGISINTVDDQPMPVVAADLSVIGLVGTAPDANSGTYPLNTPVQIFSDDATALAGLGTTGTLPDQINLINAQLGDFQVAAKIVVVRIAAGNDDDATMTNAIGSSSAKTGIWALPEAGPNLGVIPRLIGVPGLTYQQKKGVTSVAVGTQGSGYTTAPTVAFSGGGGSGAAGTAVLGTGGDAGKVVSVTITNPGTGYTTAPSVSFSGGGGTGAAATSAIDKLANPVVAALPAVLSKLLGHAVVSGPHDTLANYTDWRETINSRRIIPVETWVKVGAGPTTIDSVGAILGLMVRVDHQSGGVPNKSAANQPVYGIVGPNRNIAFSLTDDATEAQQILSQNGGVIIRGEAGVETAISSGGFIFVGTDNSGDNEVWRFYNVTRMRDYVHLGFLKTLRVYLGRRNLDIGTIEDVRSTMNSWLSELQARNKILGYAPVTFSRGVNTPEQIRLGRFTVSVRFEEAPVLRFLGIQSARYRPALDDLLDDLIASADIVTQAAA